MPPALSLSSTQPLAAAALPSLSLVTFLSHVRRSHDQERKSGGMQHTLGDTTHGPALQPTVSMRCHRDHVTALKDSYPLDIFAVLRHPGNTRCNIVPNGGRPRNGKLVIYSRSCNQPCTHLLYCSPEILLRLLQDGFSFSVVDLPSSWHDDDLCEMERTCLGSRYCCDELRSRCNGSECKYRTIKRDERAQRTPTIWTETCKQRLLFTQEKHRD